MQFEVSVRAVQIISDADHRGDADAGRHQDVAVGIGGNLEQVARLADLKFGAHRHVAVECGGTAARRRLELHRDQVRALIRCIAEGVLSGDLGGADNVDVCPRRGRGKFRPVGAFQPKGLDVAGFVRNLGHFDPDLVHVRTPLTWMVLLTCEDAMRRSPKRSAHEQPAIDVPAGTVDR